MVLELPDKRRRHGLVGRGTQMNGLCRVDAPTHDRTRRVLIIEDEHVLGISGRGQADEHGPGSLGRYHARDPAA
ncbi:MAG TPA: hypothetical protein VF933_03075, partial [Streptosporangiaceae bacterium]